MFFVIVSTPKGFLLLASPIETIGGIGWDMGWDKSYDKLLDQLYYLFFFFAFPAARRQVVQHRAATGYLNAVTFHPQTV